MGTRHEPIDCPSRQKPKRAKPRKCVVCGRSVGPFASLPLCEEYDFADLAADAGRPAAVHRRSASPIHRANSKAAGRRLVLEAQAQEDLLVAANAALAELARLDGLSTGRKSGVRPAAYRGLRNALWHLDALDG